MAKLPTLNVDVRVNTRTMQKDIDNANKQLQNIGGKGLAFAGGQFGKVGALGALGGGAGSLAIAAGASALMAAAPFMASRRIIDSFTGAVDRAETALAASARNTEDSTWRTTGVAQMFSERLAAASEFSAELEAKNKGFWDTFWASAANDQGQIGGILGGTLEASGSVMDSLKEMTARVGTLLGGGTTEEARIQGLIATSGQGASAFAADLEAARQAREQMSVGERVLDYGSVAANVIPPVFLYRMFNDLFG